ncbi:MAG: uncharacterized protein QG641_1979 [Candidatus Poribacteria bacterium]|nr:uncharacterized protein [Candidatus Poribacteria bacterium]
MLLVLSNIIIADDLSDAFKAYQSGDFSKAAKLYEKACEGGYAKGCVAVGLMYDNGKGVKQNRSRAKELFGKACDMKLQAGCDEYKLLNVQGY